MCDLICSTSSQVHTECFDTISLQAVQSIAAATTVHKIDWELQLTYRGIDDISIEITAGPQSKQKKEKPIHAYRGTTSELKPKR